MGVPPGAGRGSRLSRPVGAPPPFVGRHQEIDRLGQWLREAVAGRPRVVLVEGDAGIGKTRFLQETRAIAQRLHMQVHTGRCYEDLALPYLPFIESLLPELNRLAQTREHAGSDLDVVGRLIHVGASSRAGVEAPAVGQADQDKLQLFVAVGQGAVRLAQQSPILFAVEDLHWADRLTLDLLEHLAFTLSETAMREPVRLVVVGTHRPVDTDGRLARLIARLQREDICRSFVLQGLNETETQELIGGLGLARPSHQLTATVSGATQGNPLFIQEVLHHLVQRHALQEQGGYLVTSTDAADLRLPAQVTGAIVARTQGLSEACGKILTLASFLGERFSVDALAAASGVAEEELLDLLEEGARQRLLWSEGQAFQFAHPLIRHVFYQEPSAARRERIHKQIADSLQQRSPAESESHFLEIAHHLVRAGSAAPADVVVAYARRAADHAFTVFAWSDAARYYEAALAAGAATGALPPQDRAELHFRAGLSHYYDQDVGPCLHQYERAIEAYRQSGDIAGLAQALMEKTRTHFTLATVPLGTVTDLKPLEEILPVLGDRAPGLRGHIAAVMAEAYRNGRQAEQAKLRGQQALEIGQELEDDHLCAYAGFALGLAHINDLDVRQALDCWERAVQHARRADDVIREGWARHRIPLALTLLGRLDEADTVAAGACESTLRSHDWGNHSLGLSHRACVAVAHGDFDVAECHVHETLVMVSRSRYPWGGFRALLALACARAHRGAWTEAHDALDALLETGRVFDDPGPVIHAFTRCFRQLMRAYAEGDDSGLEALAVDVLKVVGTDTYSLAPLCALIELAEGSGTAAIAEQPVQLLSRAAERGVLFSSGWMFLISRVLGLAAMTAGRLDEADARLRAATETARTVGARPELARSCLDHARLLIARGGDEGRARAIELVKEAAPIFTELGMPAFARRADAVARTLGIELPIGPAARDDYPGNLSDREAEVLVHMARGRTRDDIARDLVLGDSTIAGHIQTIFEKTKVGDEAGAAAYAAEQGFTPELAAVPRAGASPLHIILVTDVVGSSALIRRAGDVKAHDLMERHNTLIRQCLRAHQGTEITHTGDGIEASFSAASNAVECAVAIQRAFARHNRERPGERLDVRIGLNAGEPIVTEGRLFGAAVHAAFGICARAGAGQILVSDVVSQLVAGKRFRLIDRARVALKGLGRVRLHEIVWDDTTQHA